MKYPIAVSGCEGQQIELDFSYWTGSKILINGEKAPKGKQRLEYLVTRNDGTQTSVFLKQQALGMDAPIVKVDDQEIRVLPALKWYEWVWLGLPLIYVFLGGALPVLIGFIGLSVNVRVFRENTHTVVKYILTGLVTGLLGILLIGISFVVSSLLKGGVN